MYTRNRCGATALFLLCALLFTLLAGSAVADEAAPLAELHVEKNGLPLDLTLEKLEIEDGSIVIMLGMDKITGWKDEEAPGLIVSCKNPDRKFKTDLFTAETVKSLPSTIKDFKTTMKFPYEGETLPDEILIDLGEDEPMILWPSADSEIDAAVKAAVRPKTDEQSAIEEAERLFDAGEYYEAALAIRDCSGQKRGELMDRIAEALKDREPKTGELERNFPFYGKNCVRATAATGPFEMIITDTEDENLNTRFYVRQGDTSEVYLPASSYHVVINKGNIWFGDEIGFGELCESSDFGGDTLNLKSGVKGNTMNWQEWSPIF